MTTELYVLVEFLSADEGGRRTNIYLNGGGYRPHFRVLGDTELLGVEFLVAPDRLINPHEEITAKISLIYHPNVSYENLIKGTEFEILEGERVVGKGTVIDFIPLDD